MRIYLIRHTTPGIDSGICYGQADVGLGENFEEEKDAVLNKMGADPGLEIIYTSPLHRCVRLAGSLNGSRMVTDDRLLEMNFGEWELKKWDSIDQRKLDAWMSDFVEQMPPGGESLRMLYRRVGKYIGHLLREPFETVAVVTHAGVIRCFWAHLTGVPFNQLFSVGVDYGDVFIVQIEQDITQATIRKVPARERPKMECRTH